MLKSLHDWVMLKRMLTGLRNLLVKLELWESCDLYGDCTIFDLGLDLFHVRTIVFSGMRHRISDALRKLKASMIPTLFYQVLKGRDLENIIFDVEDADVFAAMEELKLPCKAIDWELSRKWLTFSNLKELVIRTNGQSGTLAEHVPGVDPFFQRTTGRGIVLRME